LTPMTPQRERSKQAAMDGDGLLACCWHQWRRTTSSNDQPPPD